MFLPVHYFGEGGSGPQNDRSLLYSSGTGSPVIWCGDMGGDPVDWTYPRVISTQGGKKDDGDETSYKDVR